MSFESGVQDQNTLLETGTEPTAEEPAAEPPADEAPQKKENRRLRGDGAFHVPSGEGLNFWLFGDTYTFKGHSHDTNGEFALVEASIAPGGGPDWHFHDDTDESFYLINGHLEFGTRDSEEGEERVWTVLPGDFVFIPRQTWHRFTNKKVQPATMIFTYNPAGPEWLIPGLGKISEPGVPAPHRSEEQLPDAPRDSRTVV